MDIRAIVCSAVLLWVGMVTAQNNYPLNYKCLPNGTMFVENPDISTYFSASSFNMDTVSPCTTTGQQFGLFGIERFVISNCPKDTEIALTISSRASAGAIGDGVIGGAQETYIILCKELPMEGVLYQANQALTVKVPDPTAPVHVNPANVTFSISNLIWTSDYGATVNSANIGTQLKWHIKGPVQFDLLPVHCVAYAGTAVGGSTFKLLTLNGCSQDSSLVSDFRSAYGPDSSVLNEVYTNLYAFKFVNYDYITLACTVRVCNDGSQACVKNCTSSGRKKRAADAFSTHDIDRLRQLLKEEKQASFERETDEIGGAKGYIASSIRITPFESSSCRNGGLHILLLVCAVLGVMFANGGVIWN